MRLKLACLLTENDQCSVGIYRGFGKDRDTIKGKVIKQLSQGLLFMAE